MEKALFDMTQERDDWKASDARQRERTEFYRASCYELMKEVKEVALLASSDDSHTARTPRQITAVPRRLSRKMPTSARASRKRNSKPPTPNAS